ncbi:MAG: ABC transporter substrate-binding protein [Burkholderiales bacterium]|nr:ABC transporter substrate-binding protein [Burkholderiales bacterium]
MRPVRPWIRVVSVVLLAASAWLLAGSARAQDIVVGQIGPFTVLPSPDASEINVGVKAYFAQVNARGGIQGRKLSLFELDDKFNGDEFARQLEVAMQRKPVALISPIGSAAMQKLVQAKLLDQYSVVVVNAIPGADAFRKPGHEHLFHVRASDRQQIEKIISNAQAMGISRFQVLYQALPIGASGMAVAKEIAAREGKKVEIGGFEAKHGDPEIAEAAKKIAAAQPQGVLLIGSPKFMADALRELRKAGVTQFVFALSYLPPALAVKVAGPEGARGLGIAQTFPNPGGVALPVQRDFRAAMTAFDAKIAQPTSFHLEGYLSARVLVEGLKRAGPDAKPPALARALRELGEMNFGGYRVDFSASNSGSKFVDIGVVSAQGRLIY